jgi:hypothetical protein
MKKQYRQHTDVVLGLKEVIATWGSLVVSSKVEAEATLKIGDGDDIVDRERPKESTGPGDGLFDPDSLKFTVDPCQD